MQTEFDAIVVGAGPSGSTAAILLARAGWSVALVEKQRFPRRKVCGECIAASNLPLLHALGLGPRIEADAGPELRRVALMRGNRTVIAALPAAAHEKYRWGRALGRETLDTMLLERARACGAQVLQPWSVQAIDGAPGNFRCELRAIDSQALLSLRAPIAIDAHGSWEALAPRRAVHRPSDLFAFKANFRDAALGEGLLPVLSFDGGYGGMVVADRGLTTVACCIRRDRLDACREALPGVRAGEVIEAMLKRNCLGVHVALRAARREGAWLASGPLDPGIRLRGGDDRLRIGNAAGEAHPIIGEGISMALQSAWLLCAQLLARKAREQAHSVVWQREIGRRYAGEWRRQFAPRLRLAAAFAQLAMRPAAAVPLLALAASWPALLTQGARWSKKVHCAIDPGDLK
jgi:2-polyprenyl-6-methoxyphenol hydroxylase-like FAD-dependent oxidoreductase